MSDFLDFSPMLCSIDLRVLLRKVLVISECLLVLCFFLLSIKVQVSKRLRRIAFFPYNSSNIQFIHRILSAIYSLAYKDYFQTLPITKMTISYDEIEFQTISSVEKVLLKRKLLAKVCRQLATFLKMYHK